MKVIKIQMDNNSLAVAGMLTVVFIFSVMMAALLLEQKMKSDDAHHEACESKPTP